MPIFLALFRLLDHDAAKRHTATAFLTDELAESFGNAEAVRGHPDHGDVPRQRRPASRCRSLAAILVVAMTATTFTTQRQLMSKNMPADALTGPYAQQQKMLLYVLPVVFAVGGIAFPIGVLFYWTTSNLWTMGQQFYVIRNNPAPGTAGVRGEGGARRGQGRASTATRRRPTRRGATPRRGRRADRRPQQRQQPKRQSREQRKKSGGARAHATSRHPEGEQQ